MSNFNTLDEVLDPKNGDFTLIRQDGVDVKIKRSNTFATLQEIIAGTETSKGINPSILEGLLKTKSLYNFVNGSEYQSTSNYDVGFIVRASDGNQYYCNKVNISSSPVNPVGDTSDTWRQYPFKKLTKTNQVAFVFYDGLIIESGSVQCTASPAWSGTQYGSAAFCTEFGSKPIIIASVNQEPDAEINIPNVSYGLNTPAFAISNKSKVQVNIQPVKSSQTFAADITAVYLAIGNK